VYGSLSVKGLTKLGDKSRNILAAKAFLFFNSHARSIDQSPRTQELTSKHDVMDCVNSYEKQKYTIFCTGMA